MKKLLTITLLFCVFFAQAQVHHRLRVTIDPKSSMLVVVDQITIPEGQEINFLLNAALEPKSMTKGLSLHKMKSDLPGKDVGMDQDDADGSSKLKVNKWRIAWQDRYPNSRVFTIGYTGRIKSVLEQSEKNYQRGFAESPGIIDEKGIYLAGSTYWIPIIGDEMMTFDMDVKLPRKWKSVSQGERTEESSTKTQHLDHWVCTKAQEEIFVIGAQFTEYSLDGKVKAMAFLRTPDEGLANKYLETTTQYLEMYESILGEYPYGKFALVENFWETGYGMPSFTLLGEEIIRFPFILHSSYPHELLHNWWGNSVYVEFEKGNWCEGLTAYMADHLINEQRGKGGNYRRSTLQKFTDLVNPQNDFPIVDFRSRFDGPSEAIGYGKTMMMWHMLRQKYGDKDFLKALRLFYKHLKFQKASFDDIRLAFESVTGEDLSLFFEQWTKRKGAPELVLAKTDVKDLRDGHFKLVVTLQQKQAGKPYVLDVPIVVVTKSGTQEKVVAMTEKEQAFELDSGADPLTVMIDPNFDLFRILDAKEVAPALTKAYGAKQTIIVLPKGSTAGSIYDTFAKSWVKSDPSHFKIVTDKEIKKIPKGQSIWVLGYENKLAKYVEKGLAMYGASWDEANVSFPGKIVSKKGNDVIITLANPRDENQALVFIAIGNEDAIPGLVRKLPHYGKYSYLAFEGTAPTNIAKGQWPAIQSPLNKNIKQNPPKAQMKEREAMAYLKPIFSKKNMMAHIEFLASAKMKGRGLGTPELDVAADYIAQQFEKAGLQPGGDNHTYYQKWVANVKGKFNVNLQNVIGIIEGSNPKLNSDPVVISAHYDHLGKGWPDVHDGDKGKIHFGADDNASGVAVMLELATRLAKTSAPQRTIIFVAFTGEEAGLVGSRYFVAQGKNKFLANINLDTEGSLFDKKIMILNANTASDWKHIFMGTDYVTGIPTQLVMKQLDSSDQGAFIEKGIPAIQFFTGANANYHRPTDTPNTIDQDGLVKVATVAKEVLLYLGDRDRKMAFTGGKQEGHPSEPAGESKRATTGSVPSFSYEGKGVQIGSVPPGSPAEKAGWKANDIIIRMAGKDVVDLRGYSNLLKTLKPGQKVSATLLRAGKEMNSEIILKAR